MMNKQANFTIFVKLYPKVETCNFQIGRLQTIKDVKDKIRELYVGLTDQDSLRFVWNNKPLNSDDLSMWDIGVEEMDTFHVVVRGPNEQNYEPKEKKPKSLTDNLADDVILNMFSFLDTKTLCWASLVERKWKNLVQANENIFKWNAYCLFEKHDPRDLFPVDAAEPNSEESPRSKNNLQFSFLFSKLPFKKILMERTKLESEYANFERNFNFSKLEKHSTHPATMAEDAPETPSKSSTNQENERLSPDFGDLARISVEQMASRIKGLSKEGGTVSTFNFKKRPKDLSKDEKEFLRTHDSKSLKKMIRKSTSAKEQYIKYKKLKQKKVDLEKEEWKSVPVEFQKEFGLEKLLQLKIFSGKLFGNWIFYYHKGMLAFQHKSEKQAWVCAKMDISAHEFKLHHLYYPTNSSIGGAAVKEFFGLLQQVSERFGMIEKREFDLKKRVFLRKTAEEDIANSFLEASFVTELNWNSATSIVPQSAAAPTVHSRTASMAPKSSSMYSSPRRQTVKDFTKRSQYSGRIDLSIDSSANEDNMKALKDAYSAIMGMIDRDKNLAAKKTTHFGIKLVDGEILSKVPLEESLSFVAEMSKKLEVLVKERISREKERKRDNLNHHEVHMSNLELLSLDKVKEEEELRQKIESCSANINMFAKWFADNGMFGKALVQELSNSAKLSEDKKIFVYVQNQEQYDEFVEKIVNMPINLVVLTQ